MKTQCEATTPASTYSLAHRCLKRGGAKKTGQRRLCAHHHNMRSKASSPAPARTTRTSSAGSR